jgi:hypothetical protein
MVSDSKKDIKNAAKQLKSKPSKRVVRATVTRLIRDIDHTRNSKSKSEKRKVLLRLAKLLSRVAYAAIIVYALKVAFDLRKISQVPILVDKYATGTLPKASDAAAEPKNLVPPPEAMRGSTNSVKVNVVAQSPVKARSMLVNRGAKVVDFTDTVRDIYDKTEWWYDKLSTGASFVGKYAAVRFNPGRRLRR